MGWVRPLRRYSRMKTGAGLGVFRSSVWLGACEHDPDQPPSSSAPLQSMPAVASRRIPCGSRGVVGGMRGARAPATKRGLLRIWCTRRPPRRRRGCGPRSGPERAPGRRSGWPDRPSGCSRAEPLGPPKRLVGAHHAARGRSGVRAIFARTAAPGHRGALASACLASGRPPKRAGPRAGSGRSRGRGLRDPPGAHPSVAATRGWRLVFGRAGPVVASRAGTSRSWGTRGRHAAG